MIKSQKKKAPAKGRAADDEQKRTTDATKPAESAKPTSAIASYKALMAMKGRKLLPRGVYAKVSNGDMVWADKSNTVIFRMDLTDYAIIQAKSQGFTVK